MKLSDRGLWNSEVASLAEILDEKDKVADMQAFARQLWLDRAKRMGIELPEEVAAAENPAG